jgi:hypothetical protein
MFWKVSMERSVETTRVMQDLKLSRQLKLLKSSQAI